MSVPVFLSSTYSYFTRQGVTDVQTIMDDFATKAAAKGWTNPGAGLYKTPVDADGRWLDVLLTRITQQKLEWRVRDQSGNTICTRRLWIATGTSVAAHIFVGEYHAHISVDWGIGWEYVHAGILDQTPETQASNSRYVFGNGTRTNTDTADSYSAWTYAAMMDNATAYLGNRATQYSGNSSYYLGWTTNGNRIIRPWGMWTKVSGDSTNPRFHGRAYQCVMLPNDIAMGTKVTLPIDAGLSGLFMVCGIPAWTTARIAIRIG